MELSDLLIFKTVVSQGGIVRAAHKLDRVQSNVTQRIKQLEAELSSALFVREGRGLRLTPSGEILLAYANQLLQIADEARSAVGTAPLRGVLRIGSNQSAVASRLPGILSEFNTNFPEVTIDLNTDTDDALIASLNERRIDAAFISSPPKRSGLIGTVFAHEQLMLITSNQHPPVTSPHELKFGVILAFSKGCSYRRALEQWLGNARLSTLQVKELSSYHAIIAAVAAGSSFAAVPQSVLVTLPSNHIKPHAICSLGRDMSTALLWRKSDHTLALKNLISMIEGKSRNSVA